MKKYAFTCTCGDKMSVEAANMEEAKTKFKETMNETAVKAHFAAKHVGEDLPDYEMMMEMALANLAEEPVEEDAAMSN